MKKIAVAIYLLIAGITAFAQSPQDVFQRFSEKICRVQFYKNVSSQAQIGSYIKIEQQRTGIMVSPDGLVMVNSDVYPLSLDIISGEGSSFFSGEPSDFKIILADEREFAAEFVGKDDQAQVAFVRISESPDTPLSYVQFDSSTSVGVGQQLFLLELLGENYDYQPLFSSFNINAIIQKPRRKFLIANGDVALSAGGLVLTATGNAIGVTLRRFSEISFHQSMEFEDFSKQYLEIAPSEWMMPLIENPPVLEKNEHRGKAWFGIGMQALTPELKTYWNVPEDGGVVVFRVYPESPAEKAGLKMKDVILSIGGKAVDVQRSEELGRFKETISRQPFDEPVACVIFRDGKKMNKTITFTPAPRAVDLAEKLQLSELGMEVRELTADILYDYNLPLDTKGVYVYQVDRAAPAGLGGLEAGSIITAINGKTVENLGDFREKMDNLAATSGKKLMLQTQFRRETQFVFVDTE